MKQARESIQNLIVNSEVDDTNSDQELASNTFCQETTFLNSPMASQENTTEEGTLTLSPMSAQRKRSESSLERTPNNREMKTEVDNKSRRSSLRTPVPERLSQVSTGSSLPFAGFEIPEATVIPSDSMANLAPKQKKNLQMKEAIPVMPLPAAIVCLVLNVIIPGSGTMLSGFISFCLSRHELSSYERTMILCTNCFVGLMQLATVVFLFIGWFWSVTWGCAFVGLSSQYSKQRPKDVNANGSIA